MKELIENYTLKSDEQKIIAVGKALSSPIRIEILKILEHHSLQINEIAETLKIPSSTAAMHIQVLKEAQLIHTYLKGGSRGSAKICEKKVHHILLDLSVNEEPLKEEVISMPLGNYVNYRVEPTCGMASQEGYIDDEDEPRCFYNPSRTKAKILWLGDGFLEYRFPNAHLDLESLKEIEISAEVCSEAPDYDLCYPSDITLWLNEIEVGTWHCPSDFGGRRGALNPKWWKDDKSQYGQLKHWSVKRKSSYLDGEESSKKGIMDYGLLDQPYISVRLGIRENAVHRGGLNIFGDCFGDYPQDIVMKLKYEKPVTLK